MQRRSLLRLGLVSGAVLALGGGAAALLVEPGLRQDRLTAGAGEVLRAVGSAILDGSLPSDQRERALALDGLRERTEALIAALPPHAQAELSQLLALLASAPGRRWFAGLAADWPQARVPELRDALEQLRRSRLSLKRQAYHALHDITTGAYFSEPATWRHLGYPGPLAI